jgi:hypothetical protein
MIQYSLFSDAGKIHAALKLSNNVGLGMGIEGKVRDYGLL